MVDDDECNLQTFKGECKRVSVMSFLKCLFFKLQLGRVRVGSLPSMYSLRLKSSRWYVSLRECFLLKGLAREREREREGGRCRRDRMD